MTKEITFEEEGRNKLLEGIDKLANAVKTTLGPSGRLVMIQKNGKAPLTTKDGVTVARSIELKDPIENMGAQLAINVASKTNDVAGDGTTTATVLAQAIAHEGINAVIKNGHRPSRIKTGIDYAVNTICEELDRNSIKINDHESIKNVAAISANNDYELGEMIAKAVDKVGVNGVIRVEESKNTETQLDIVDGLQFDRGYLSPYFINNASKPICELDNPLILLYNHKLSLFEDFKDSIVYAASQKRPFLVFADDIDGEALTTLIYNHTNNKIQCCAVKAPGFNDTRPGFFQDLAMMVGGTLVSEETGTKLMDLDPKMILGSAKKVIITKNSFTVIEGNVNEEKRQERIKLIKNLLKNSKNQMEYIHLENRLAKIDGGIAIIHVGGTTEVELREKKDRVDDAVHATMAAIEEGIVPGGGTALLKASINCRDRFDETWDNSVVTGYKIIMEAIKAPLIQINDNSGESGTTISNTLETRYIDDLNNNIDITAALNFGYNAKTETYEDLIKAGVIDPVKVTKTALKNAASIASMLLSTSCVINDNPEDSKVYALPQMADMSQLPQM